MISYDITGFNWFPPTCINIIFHLILYQNISYAGLLTDVFNFAHCLINWVSFKLTVFNWLTWFPPNSFKFWLFSFLLNWFPLCLTRFNLFPLWCLVSTDFLQNHWVSTCFLQNLWFPPKRRGRSLRLSLL